MEHFDLSSVFISAVSAVIFGAAFVLISIVIGALRYFVFNAIRIPYVVAFRIRPTSLRVAPVKDVSAYIRKTSGSHISDFLFISVYGIGFSLLSYAVHDGGVRLYMVALSVGAAYFLSRLSKVTVTRLIFCTFDLLILLLYNVFSVLYACFVNTFVVMRKTKLEKLKK